MANHQILFLALFALLVLPNFLAQGFYWDDLLYLHPMSAAIFVPKMKDNLRSVLKAAFHNPSEDLIRASSLATSLFQRDPTLIATVVPMTVPREIERFSKLAKCGIHMNSTGSSSDLSSAGKKVQWNGMSQLCPRSDNHPTNYHCDNVVLVVDGRKWEKSEEGMIVYYLPYVRKVDLIGHDVYENHFDELYLTSRSTIKGGRSSNKYMIKYADAFTQIYLNSASEEEIISVSKAESQKVSIKFYAENDLIHGELAFDSSTPTRLEATDDLKSDIGNSTRDWRIYGRRNMPDNIECTNYEMIELLGTKIKITAQGSGGNAEFNDIITNCMDSMLNPFTTYKFTYPNETYEIRAVFESTASPDSNRAYSTIELDDNDVVIYFTSRNYLERILSMKYSLWTNILTLEILGDQNVIVLDVKGLLRIQTINRLPQANVILNSHLRAWPALFIMKQSSADILFPIVERLPEYDRTVDVSRFGLGRVIEGTSLDDAIEAYDSVLAHQRNGKWDIEVIVMPRSTTELFWFGTPVADSSLIFDATKYIKAQNGADSLELTAMTPEYIWIDNEAADGLVDTLQLDSGVCKDLQVEKNTADNLFIPRSEFDLVVICEKNDSGPPGKLVLMNYLKDKSYRHLKIIRDNVEYVILPREWISPAQNDSTASSLVRIIDFESGTLSDEIETIFLKTVPQPRIEPDDLWTLMAKIKTKSSETVPHSGIEPGNFWTLLDKTKTSEIEAREENSNVVLSVKSKNSSIVLKNFHKDGQVSEEWRDKFFAVADDLSDDSPKIIRATEIHNLLGQ